MKKAYSLLSAVILFLITGCEDKKDQISTMEMENTTIQAGPCRGDGGVMHEYSIAYDIYTTARRAAL
ncbi:MAG: hypothetical protein PHR75_03530, partial [Sulfurovum sp.]|nr:hypothetical protein [Sulfurovum sp.]